MTIERDGVKGPIIVCCDARGCRKSHETDEFQFDKAVRSWNREGWKAHYNSKDETWHHLCPTHEQELLAGELDESEIG